MIPNLSKYCQFAMFELIAAVMDSRSLPKRDSRSTRHLVRRTSLIPSSPANGIMSRTFEGKLPCKVSYQTYCSSALSA